MIAGRSPPCAHPTFHLKDYCAAPMHVDRQRVDHAEHERRAGYKLLHDASLVLFDVTEQHVEPSFDNEEMIVRIEMQIRDHDLDDPDDVVNEDDDPCNAEEWGLLERFHLRHRSFAIARAVYRASESPNFRPRAPACGAPNW